MTALDRELFIGIDPGVETGVAVLKRGRFIGIDTLSFWAVVDYITRDIPPAWVGMLAVEVSSSSHVWQQSMKGATKEKAAAIGQNVGAVRREGQLLVERFKALGYPVRAVDPPGNPEKRGKGKIDPRQFQLLTGHADQIVSQHQLDAGHIAWNVYHEMRLIERVT